MGAGLQHDTGSVTLDLGENSIMYTLYCLLYTVLSSSSSLTKILSSFDLIEKVNCHSIEFIKIWGPEPGIIEGRACWDKYSGHSSNRDNLIAVPAGHCGNNVGEKTLLDDKHSF